MPENSNSELLDTNEEVEQRLLIVEDSWMMQKIIKHLASIELNCPFDLANDYAEAKKLIANHEYFLAITDLNLPDATSGEIVDLVRSADITTIVLTASVDEAQRQSILKKGVLDYVIKESRESYLHAVKLANQILRNQNTKVVLADDSSTLRKLIRKNLEKMHFTVLEAKNGSEALKIIEETPEVELLITDFNMPVMNGIELINRVRRTHSRDTFPIIGLSSSTDPTLSAQFIKQGANDFLVTPFIHEEFQWRILKTMDQISLIRTISDAANQDFLTKLYNRRYFFSKAHKLYKSVSSGEISVIIGLIDIDFFKVINDEYGHDSGDAVLIQISMKLQKFFSQHMVARYGGEEFIVLLENVEPQLAFELFEEFRVDVSQQLYTIPDGKINATVSCGIAKSTSSRSLEALISNADESLYEAKKNGRNRVQSFHNR